VPDRNGFFPDKDDNAMTIALSKLRVVACLMGLAGGLHLIPARADAVSDGVARATAVIDTYRHVPVFVPPGAPFDIQAVAKGKSMLSIPNTSANQFLKGIITREIAVGQEIGLKVSEWQNQGQPSQWAQGIGYAGGESGRGPCFRFALL
jgi:ribose transport system substrate-binding protein